MTDTARRPAALHKLNREDSGRGKTPSCIYERPDWPISSLLSLVGVGPGTQMAQSPANGSRTG